MREKPEAGRVPTLPASHPASYPTCFLAGKLRCGGSAKPRCSPRPSPSCPRVPGSLRSPACPTPWALGPPTAAKAREGVAWPRAAMSAGGASRARAGGRPLPGRAGRAPKFGRLLPLVLWLQGPASGEFRRVGPPPVSALSDASARHAGWRETLTLGATHVVHLSAGPWRSTLEIGPHF